MNTYYIRYDNKRNVYLIVNHENVVISIQKTYIAAVNYLKTLK